MNNLKNTKFIEFKRNNYEMIKYMLRRDMINDLINKDYTSIEKNNVTYTVTQSNFEFYHGYELEDLNQLRTPYIQILKSTNPLEDIYAIEGVLSDNNEDVIYDDLNKTLDELVNLVMDGGFTAPTQKSICKVYDYFLSDFFKQPQTIDIYE